MHRQQLELLLTDDLLLQGHWRKEDAAGPALTSFNTLDNWGHKTPTQSKRKRTGKKRLKGHGPGHTQCTRLQRYEFLLFIVVKRAVAELTDLC